MDLFPESAIVPPSPADNFFRKPYTSTVSFAVGLLLFLLPFAELKCTSVTLADNTGIGIAIGQKWKVVDASEVSPLFSQSDATKVSRDNPLKAGPNVFALVAIGTGLFGLAYSLSPGKHRHIIGLCAGILAALMLLAIMIQFRLLLASATDIKEGDSKMNLSMVIKIRFTIWYYFSLVAFIAAAFFSYRHLKIELQDALNNHVDFDFQRDPGSAG